jgi:uncharacterized membrane protein
MTDAGSIADGRTPAAMEAGISVVLRAGVLVSAGLFLLGVALLAWNDSTGYAAMRPHDLQQLLAFHPPGGPGYFPTSLRAVLNGVLSARPYAIIELGILALIATPVLRVALSLVFFVRQRDWLYSAITSFVLVVLLSSLITGLG